MITAEELRAVCIVCLEPAPEGASLRKVVFRGREYTCAFCPACSPRAEAKDRAAYNNYLPRAVSNLTKLLGPPAASDANSS